MNFKNGEKGLGVVYYTYSGDGTFPIYVKIDKNNRPLEMIIKLK